MIDPLELPLTEPPIDVPLWSENFVFEIACPKQDIAMFFHLSRQSFDFSVWRETAVIQLPGNRVASIKGYGRGAHTNGAGSAQLRFTCIESFSHWRISLSGAARITARSELASTSAGPVRDGLYAPMSIEIDSVSDTPPWDIGGAIATHSWGKAHYQQAVSVQGVITLDGDALEFEGLGMRDHTRGPRDFGQLGPWLWMSGGAPGGKRFIVLAMDPAFGSQQPPVRLAVVGDRRSLEPVTVEALDAFDRIDGRLAVTLRDQAGSRSQIVGTRGDISLLTPMAPNQLLIGPEPTANMYSSASTARFAWDGEPCFGYVELGLPKLLLHAEA